MATKCPYCGGTNVQATNMGSRILAGVTSFAAGLAVGLFNKNMGGPTAKTVHDNICPKKEYICLNDNCRRKFQKD